MEITVPEAWWRLTEEDWDNLADRIEKQRITQWRANLSGFYKEIKVCRTCKKEYGSDLEKKNAKNICPMCQTHLVFPKTKWDS